MVHSSCSITSNDEQVREKFEIISFSSLTLGTIVVLILYVSIRWTKQQFNHTSRTQNNVLSLNQTVAIRVWLQADIFSFQLILNMIPTEKIVQFEMMKIIVVDNLCYRFLLPLILLFSTKKCFPVLWTERPLRTRRDFYQSEMRIIPRRPEPTENGEPTHGSGARYVYVMSVRNDLNMN